MIVDRVPQPDVDLDGAFQMQISALDYNSYVGVSASAASSAAKSSLARKSKSSALMAKCAKGKLLQVMGHLGLERVEVEKPLRVIWCASPASTN